MVTEGRERQAPTEDDDGKIGIIVNGRVKFVTSERVTYDEVVALAGPLPTGPYVEVTVTYRGSAERISAGELLPGKSVRVHSRTTFNVTTTDKS